MLTEPAPEFGREFHLPVALKGTPALLHGAESRLLDLLLARSQLVLELRAACAEGNPFDQIGGLSGFELADRLVDVEAAALLQPPPEHPVLRLAVRRARRHLEKAWDIGRAAAGNPVHDVEEILLVFESGSLQRYLLEFGTRHVELGHLDFATPDEPVLAGGLPVPRLDEDRCRRAVAVDEQLSGKPEVIVVPVLGHLALVNAPDRITRLPHVWARAEDGAVLGHVVPAWQRKRVVADHQLLEDTKVRLGCERAPVDA